MTKIQALKKIESTLKKSLKNLVKEINTTLKDSKVWYCADLAIKQYEQFRKPNDRNADQLVLDYIAHIMNGGEMSIDDQYKLWTKEEIEQ